MGDDGRHFRQDDSTSPGDKPIALPRDDHGIPRFGVAGVTAVVCLFFVLLEGLYLIASRPAMRIVALVGLSCLMVGGLYLWHRLRGTQAQATHRFAYRVFPVVFLVLGVFYLFFFPPNTVPDEDYHYGHTYGMANLLDPTMGPRDIRTEDYVFTRDALLFDKLVDADFWQEMSRGVPLFATNEGVQVDEELVRTFDPMSTFPQIRLFSALGILIGRIVGLSGVALYYVGRLCNFLFGFALIVAAIRLTPIGKNIMMAIALLPMTLHLLASYSYDCGIIGYAFLLTALLLRVLFAEEAPTRALLVGSVVVAGLLAPCKVIYALICVLALFAPRERFESRNAMRLWKACMLLVPVVAILLMRATKMLSVAGVGSTSTTVNTRLGEQGHFYTLSEVLANPLDATLMYLRTFYHMLDVYVEQLVGFELGWLQIDIAAKDIQTFTWLGALLLATVPTPDDRTVLPTGMRVTGVAVLAAGMLATMVSMHLGWTFVTENIIQGVQGRYLIPYLPLFLLTIRGTSLVAKIDTAVPITMAMAALDCLYLAQIAFVVLGGPMA